MSGPLRKLGELTSLVSSGSTPKGGESVYLDDGPVMLIRSQNVHMNRLALDEVAYISEDINQSMGRTQVSPDDVLLNITGASIGRVARFAVRGVRANVNQHVCIIRPRSELLDPAYLTHYLASPAFQSEIERQQVGGTRQALTFSQIRNFDVPLPPVEKQRQIAAVLDKADAIRRKRQEAIALTEKLLRSTFLEMFGDIRARRSSWPWGTARAYVEMSSGKSPKGIISEHPTEYPIYGGNGVNGWATEPLYREFIVIVGRVGQQCGIVHMAETPCWVTDNAIVIRVTSPEVLDPVYLGEALDASPIRDLVSRLDLPFINQEMLRDQPIPIPPIDLQRSFAGFRRAVLRSRTEQLRAFNESDNLFNSLSQCAFSGQL